MRRHSRASAAKLHVSLAALVAALVLVVTCRQEAAVAQPADTAVCTARAQASLDDRIRACSLLIAAPSSDSERLAVLHTSRGAAWRAKGDLDRALADQDEAIRLRPGSALLYFNRAVTWLAKNDADRAIANLAEAIQLAPGFALAYRNRGDLLYGKGDFTSAISEYSAVIRLNPNDARSLTMRGLAKWQLGDGDGGKVDIAAAMRIDVATTVALISQARPVGTGAAAAPSAVAPTIWDFKGSRVALKAEGIDRRFYYDTPRPELWISGIAAGTLLFEGREDGKQYTGKMFAFSHKCGTRSYDVNGPVADSPLEAKITLSGQRPQLDANCRPTGNFQSDVLVFSYPAR
jgi:Flp pilus assembly protein TadD